MNRGYGRNVDPGSRFMRKSRSTTSGSQDIQDETKENVNENEAQDVTESVEEEQPIESSVEETSNQDYSEDAEPEDNVCEDDSKESYVDEPEEALEEESY